jgi:apolipoprotein N-acyltransferase
MGKSLIPALLAGLLVGVGATYSTLWFLALAGMALYLQRIWCATSTWKSALLQGCVFSFIVSGASIGWFFDAYPLDWLGIHGAFAQGAVLFLAWLVVSLSLTIGPAAVSALLWVTRTNPYRIVIAALLWVLAEEARMWGFAALTFSPSSLIGPHFSVASIGYVFANSPFLLQIASWGGLSMLTLCVVVFAGALASVVCVRSDNREKYLAGLLVGTVLALPLLHGVFLKGPADAGGPLRVLLVSTKDVADASSHSEEDVAELVTRAATTNPRPDMVIFPENYAVSSHVPRLELHDAREILFVSSEKRTSPTGAGYTVDLTYDSTTRGRIATYHKQFFMPLGEYAPTLAIPLFSLVKSESVDRYLNRLSGLTRKGQGFVSIPYKGRVLGGLLCSESISPYLYTQLSKQGATVLINSANPAWFRGSRTLHEKLLRIGKVQAVSNSAYFLQASNDLPSFAISPTGTVIASSSWDGIELLEVLLP